MDVSACSMDMQYAFIMQMGEYANRGIPIYFDDVLSSPAEVVNSMMVHEEEDYMADFVSADDGSLLQIRFDRVKY